MDMSPLSRVTCETVTFSKVMVRLGAVGWESHGGSASGVTVTLRSAGSGAPPSPTSVPYSFWAYRVTTSLPLSVDVVAGLVRRRIAARPRPAVRSRSPKSSDRAVNFNTRLDPAVVLTTTTPRKAPSWSTSLSARSTQGTFVAVAAGRPAVGRRVCGHPLVARTYGYRQGRATPSRPLVWRVGGPGTGRPLPARRRGAAAVGRPSGSSPHRPDGRGRTPARLPHRRSGRHLSPWSSPTGTGVDARFTAGCASGSPVGGTQAQAREPPIRPETSPMRRPRSWRRETRRARAE